MFKLSALGFLMLVLAGCSSPTATLPSTSPPVPSPTSEPTPAPTATPIPQLLLIAGEPVDWEGEAAALAQEYGWTLQPSEPVTAAELLPHSQAVAAVISVGEAFGGALEEAAENGVPVVAIDVPGAQPQMWFSTVGGARHDQAGFLAGVMIGLASQTGWVGLVEDTGGPNEAEYRLGFEQGLLWGCPRCQVITQAAGEMTIDRFRANTVDAAFPIPGPEASAVAESLSEADIPMVWVGEDGPPSNWTIGRISTDSGQLVVQALADLVETGEGKKWSVSIGSRSIFVLDINDTYLSPGRQRLLNDAYEAIASDKLDIGTDMAP